jgi:antitoxin HicB
MGINERKIIFFAGMSFFNRRMILSESGGLGMGNRGLCYTLNDNPKREMSRIYKVPLILEPHPEGGYVVACPLLPELITEGDNVRDALQNANDTLAAVVEALKENTPLSIETVLAV